MNVQSYLQPFNMDKQPLQQHAGSPLIPHPSTLTYCSQYTPSAFDATMIVIRATGFLQ